MSRPHEDLELDARWSQVPYEPDSAAEQETLEQLRREAENVRATCFGPTVVHRSGRRECLGACGGHWSSFAHPRQAISSCREMGAVRLRYPCGRCAPAGQPGIRAG
jgi:hypothetical protein